MNLPQISIPVNIPFDIPTMLHQPLVHFAIAIPVLLLLVEIVNLFLNNTTLKATTSIFLFLLVGILFGAYLTGTTDGKHAIDNGFNAISELKEHKLDGIYLFYASIFVLVIKLISVMVNKVGFNILYILILIAFNAGILHQGKEGGELVFKHAANVQMPKDDFDDDEDEDETTTTKQTVKAQEIPVKKDVKPAIEPKKDNDNNVEENTTKTQTKQQEATQTNETNTTASSDVNQTTNTDINSSKE